MYSDAQQRSFFDLSKQFLQSPATHDQVDDLRQILVFHEWKYYVQNNPVLSDYEYDQLFKQLQKIELEHPDLITSDSPTMRVSQDLTNEFKKVKHLTPMLSLDNSYNAEDLEDFAKSVRKVTGVEDLFFAVEPKFDGGSIALV